MTLGIVGVSADLDVFQEVESPVACESYFERETLRRPAHEAHFYAISPCDVLAVCNERRLLAKLDNGWLCEPGCGQQHTYKQIRWVPITKE